MSYLGKVERFKCDSCERIEEVQRGLPKNWVWLKTGGRVAHACESCKEEIPKAQHMKAGQLN